MNLSIITFSIDMTLVDKTKIKKFTRKNGVEGEFIDFVLLPSRNTQYGDYIVKQSQSKEERESGAQSVILGNAKILSDKPASKAQPTRPAPAKTIDREDDDVPF